MSHDSVAIGFNDESRQLYVAVTESSVEPVAKQEVIAYEPVPIGELIAAPGQCAVTGAGGADADVAFACALEGEADPWGVPETGVWFQWGRGERGLSERTVPPIHLANTKKEGEEDPLAKVSAPVGGLLPNETIYDEVVGEDANVLAPETFTSATGSFATPSVPPRVLGEPVASFPTPTSVVMVGRINPEHTPTRYGFEYAPLAGCPNLATEPCSGRLETSVLSSPTYGGVPIAQEVTGLQTLTHRAHAQARQAKTVDASLAKGSHRRSSSLDRLRRICQVVLARYSELGCGHYPRQADCVLVWTGVPPG